MKTINFENQIKYWKKGAISDIETAELLINNNKNLHGLFFCHLVIDSPDSVSSKKHLQKTKDLLKWLIQKLEQQ